LINKLVLENLKHRPIRTLLTITAIGLQVTMILTLVGLSRGTIENSAARTKGVGADLMIRPPGSSVIGLSGAPLPEAVVPFVQKWPHVTVATGTVEHSINIFDRITGIDLDQFNRMSGGLEYLEGGPFKNPGDVLVDEYYARQHNMHAGQTIQILNGQHRIAGVFRSGKFARFFMQIHELQSLTANSGKVTVIYAKVDNPANLSSVIEGLKQKFPDYQIYSMEEFLSLLSVDSVPLLKSFIHVVVGLAVVFGFLVVFLAMYTAVLERTREIGILKALGASPAFILRILIRETVMLAIIGSILGILLTYGTRFAIMKGVGASLTQTIVPDWWPISTAIAVVGAMLGAIYPGLKAARQDAIEALSYE
jgi:putative ABC transport system permease protein